MSRDRGGGSFLLMFFDGYKSKSCALDRLISGSKVNRLQCICRAIRLQLLYTNDLT